MSLLEDVLDQISRLPVREGHYVAAVFRDAGYSIHATADMMRTMKYKVEVHDPAQNGKRTLNMSRFPTGTQGVSPELCGETANPILFGEVIWFT